MPVQCQTKSLSQGAYRIEISLERKEGADWRPVDPGLIFRQNDEIRFRILCNFDGYLYVMNHGTSGQYRLLFPHEEMGQMNMIQAAHSYLVPSAKGWFRIMGPPGHEIVYWLVTPVELPGEDRPQKPYVPLPPPPKSGKLPPSLIPRCDDAIFRSRGECIDTSAGPRGIDDEEALPENLAGLKASASRDLVFDRQQKSSVVSSPASLTGPVIFEYRLAHR
jgi:hypothetical protein